MFSFSRKNTTFAGNINKMTTLPSRFVQEMQALLGNEYPDFAAALAEKSPVSIRLNPLKATLHLPPLPGAGEASTLKASKVPWCQNGYYLESRPSFTADPLFHAGVYYVQEASSMYIEQIIRQYITEPAVCLDVCAAPGGKSTHLLDVLPPGSLLVANEVIRSRAHILAENLIKWGNPATIVTQNDPGDMKQLKHSFDVMLVDAPCSGEGMFRKNPQAVHEWSPAHVALCAARQQRIVADVWPALKPGGLLIYSTCTFNTKENEENIQWMTNTFGAEPLTVERFFPHRVRGEGLFIAALRKPAETTFATTTAHDRQNRKPKQNPPIPPQIYHWIESPEQYDFHLIHPNITAIPQAHGALYRLVGSKLHVLSAGISTAGIKGKDLIPHHALAMSVALNRKAFPVYETDEATAIRYLAKEAIFTLPPELPKSYILLTYRNRPLGFVKNIGNRANNMYPQEWRIKSEYFREKQ
ncbi:MAG: rRNA cytosine-C5-methyltransferase [Dysgonamonadaceae bacterium]|jgi:16S rRNA C967 or C1407 C5-methylase (RsmB/RsmF family)/NOL1/NOP2/fmu family ribosome biogenesis protein|nr:rRNA cytosine-C5-methyltransferase [Dysgonamonadaceae bacterium]